MNPITIVGSGLAGYSVAREFRKHDKQTPLRIITADDGASYSKPMLSNALTKGKTSDALVMADAQTMSVQLDADVLIHTRVDRIDVDEHKLFANGQVYVYSKLVLALGADPFRLSLEGDAAGQVLSVNDLHDYIKFRTAIEGKKRIAVLGGGLIGSEFANDLANHGYQVSLVDRHDLPLGSLLPETLSQNLLAALQALGVQWYGNATVQRVDHDGDAYRITLDNGERFHADVLLSATGLRARTELAQQAGLKTDRAIEVNALLQTSHEDVYALGDCAQVQGHFLPFIMPLMRSAKALGQTLAGKPTAVTFPAMPVVIKTPIYPLSVLPPPSNVEGQWRNEQVDGGMRCLFHDGKGQLCGFALSEKAVSEGTTLGAAMPGLF